LNNTTLVANNTKKQQWATPKPHNTISNQKPEKLWAKYQTSRSSHRHLHNSPVAAATTTPVSDRSTTTTPPQNRRHPKPAKNINTFLNNQIRDGNTKTIPTPKPHL
jgi:hypothetical protein